MNHESFGIIAGVVSAVAYVPYVWSILRGRTKPNRVTWAIWSAMCVIICFSYHSAAESHTAWLVTVSHAVGSASVFLCSLRYGVGGLEWLDVLCFIGAIFGAVLWWIFDSPVTALTMGILMDFIGLIPTMTKSWKKPQEEDLFAWTLSTVGAAINLFAVTDWTSFATFIYPLYVIVGIGSVWLILIATRFRKYQ